MSRFDGITAYALFSSDGSIEIVGSGAADLRVAGGGQVSSGKFFRLAAPATTQSAAPVLLTPIPFVLASGGPIFATVNASILATPQIAAETFCGAIVTLDVDGVPLPDQGFFELDITPFATASINTFTATLAVHSNLGALAAGPHTLNVFWQTTAVANGDVQLDIAAVDMTAYLTRL
jgi:hypothetical protein